jgi:hypothetical protein
LWSAAALRIVSISGESTFSEFLMYFGLRTKSTMRALGRFVLACKASNNSRRLAGIYSVKNLQHCSPDPGWISWDPAFRKGYELCSAFRSFLNQLACLRDALGEVEPFWLSLGDSDADGRWRDFTR